LKAIGVGGDLQFKNNNNKKKSKKEKVRSLSAVVHKSREGQTNLSHKSIPPLLNNKVASFLSNIISFSY
jgi:predicted component of type VI protein secretion system